MTALAAQPPPIAKASAAAALARQRWATNRAALQRHQPEIVELTGDFPHEVEWVFARDHSLTCLNADGSWWAGCSVPRAAAVKLLASLDPSAMVSAYLAPEHAELLCATRARMGPDPALIALVTSVQTLRILIAAGDFADQITAHRLWFVAGADWADGLRKLFQRFPGLAPAGRFVRTKLTDLATTEALIGTAQQVLGEVAAARTAALHRLRQMRPRASQTVERLLVVSPSRFRLWDDATPAIDEAAARFDERSAGHVLKFDIDDPLNASPLALAEMAADCDAVLAANVYRSDSAGSVSAMTPWLTWVTRGPIARFDPAATYDRLVVATTALAGLSTSAGWPASAIIEARHVDRPPTAAATLSAHLAILADLAAVAIPQPIDDLSSHRLLWDFIDAEIDANPFAIGDDPVGYLLAKAGEIGIVADELDVVAFVDKLIIPRWQRAVARMLVAAHVPLLIYGRGWQDEPGVASAFVGTIDDRSTFERACAGATALIHAWPGMNDHPINDAGAPVLRATSSFAGLLQAAKLALNGRLSSSVKLTRSALIPLQKVLDSLT